MDESTTSVSVRWTIYNIYILDERHQEQVRYLQALQDCYQLADVLSHAGH